MSEIVYLNSLEHFEHHDHTLLVKPVHELRGIQLPAVSCQGRAGDVSASGNTSALLLVAVFETCNEHVVAHILEESRITVVIDESLFFGLMIFCSLSVVCFVGRLVHRALETGALVLCHLVGQCALN